MRNKYLSILVILMIMFLVTSCDEKNDLVITNLNDTETAYCDVKSYIENNEIYTNEVIEFDFEDALFQFNKLNFIGEESNNFYVHTLKLLGNEIEIKYVDENEEYLFLNTTSELDNLPAKTLYIKTDKEYLVLSIPTVYEELRIYDSIQTESELEKGVSISNHNGVYYITLAFPEKNDYVGEFFYLKSQMPLWYINEKSADLIIRTELSSRFRLLSDGFYQTSYETYFPTGEGSYFRNSANYIAYHFMKYNEKVAESERLKYFDYMAYASTFVVNAQMSDFGFFETKSRSNWLYMDFLIEDGFYDTRFNADNGEINILLYNQFKDEYFLKTLELYGDFFVNYAKEYSYKTDRGILVEDYYNPKGGQSTHSSLNHHIANLNLLISIYEVTNDEKYLDTALLMLYGVEDTKDQWILEDNNLRYALYYTGTNNIMVDYPYLTYDDLFVARERLGRNGIDTKVIDELMAAKKIYMMENNITGYKE